MSKEKILIINEPFVPDFCRTQRWAARTRGRVLRPPDWLAYSAAVLEREKIEVGLYDFPAKGWDKPQLRDLVRREQPAAVVLDSTTPSIYSDIECAKICKEEGGDPKIIMVGPHASVQAEETLIDGAGAVDAVAVGEYEYTVRDYVKAVLNGSGSYDSIQGMVWLDGGRVVRNEPRPPIENLDELPFPAWGHLNLWDYFDGVKLFPFVDIIGGRGCPFKCVFCLWPQVMHGNRYRLRSAENIVEEMNWVLDTWPKVKKGEFFFEDDTFTVNKGRAHAFCELLLKQRRKSTWSVNVRADITDIDLLKHMKNAGCRMLLVGFESGSQKMLDNMQKGVKVERMTAFVKAAKSVGLQIHGCFVLGLPGETVETMEQTIDFALNNPLDTVQFSGAVPFPGTKYYRYAEEQGLLRAQKWDEWLNDGEQASVVDYPGLSKRQVDQYVDEGLKRFYLRPSYMVRFLLATRSKQDLYRKLRGAGNYFDYLLRKKA